MTIRITQALSVLILGLMCLGVSWRAPVDLKPIVIDTSYEHDRFGTLPRDIVVEMGAYIVSFDSADDDNHDGIPDRFAIPEWVSYEIKRFEGELGAGPERPSEWITDQQLLSEGVMPADDSYHFSNQWRKDNPNSPMLGYDRGHMCMKQIAWRMGADEDWNTHSLMNACPQKATLNQGIWLDLEERTQQWADEFDSVWVICGPLTYERKPRAWLGQVGEVPVAIPDAFFKVVIKDADNGGLDVLAFIYPQEGIDYKVKAPKTYNHTPYLTCVDEIEALTGLDLLSALDDELEATVESIVRPALWE